METPKDIDYLIYEANLDGLGEMYLAAVTTYRQGIVNALCKFTREFAPGRVHAVRLSADTDWRWCFDGFVDEAGEDVEHEWPEEFYFEDLFSSAYLSELDDFEVGTAYVYVADREFSALHPDTYATWKGGQQA